MTAPAIAVCTPMRLEQRALRRSRVAGSLVRTGPGRRNACAAAQTRPVREAAGVAVVGLAGATDPSLEAGDVVVATEVRADDAVPLPCPSAPLVAASLRAAGLRVVLGPVHTVDHLAGVSEKRRRAAEGVVAVDTESRWLLPEDRPGVVVRVVADRARDPLLRPATAARLHRALRVLGTTAAAVDDWGRALGARQVLLAEPRSFCAGVDRAIEVVERALEQRGAPVYVRKQIVHNVHVVSDLSRRGAVFVDEIDEVPPGSTLVFSAHGVSPAVRAAAAERDLDVIDATCPLVTKVHTEVRRFADRGDTILLIGHDGHEETEGTLGERPDRTILVRDEADARRVEVPDPDRVSYLVQTTLSTHEVESVVAELSDRFPRLKAPPTDDICYATTNRQHALAEVARDADVVLVLGSANSSNSRRLVETAERLGTPAHLVDDAEDVPLSWLAGARTVGITAGASAPPALVDELVRTVSGLGPVEPVTRQHTTEDIHFALPKEVRTP